VKMAEETTRKLTLQGHDLPRGMDSTPCQEDCKRLNMAETEAPCRRVFLKSAVRTQKILDKHHRLRVPLEKIPEQVGRSRRQDYRISYSGIQTGNLGLLHTPVRNEGKLAKLQKKGPYKRQH